MVELVETRIKVELVMYLQRRRVCDIKPGPEVVAVHLDSLLQLLVSRYATFA